MAIPHDLATLPSELLLHILSYLDVPDLLALSRTTHTFRALSLDPLLHSSRLRRNSLNLSRSLSARPSLAELIAHRIYITRTTLAARLLGRNLIKIRLSRSLASRRSAEELVELGVLPAECFGRGRGVGKVAPALVEKKRAVERERVRDFLRGWVEEWRRRGGEMAAGEEGRPDVRRMARRFGNTEREGRRETPRWGRKLVVREAPTRAKVLGLRHFWEKVGKDGVSS